jgi:uncharacterized protein YyaL (SSP411 family)
LLRRFRQGAAEIEGYAEDYAFMVFGLLELFQADPDVAWLRWAVDLQRRQDELFWDEQNGGWFSTTGRDPSVLVRLKEDYDGAEPTASSISVGNLLVLSHLVHDSAWPERIERTLRVFGSRLEQVGRAVPMMAAALSAYHAGPRQLVIVGDQGADALERIVVEHWRPFLWTVAIPADRHGPVGEMLPVVAAMRPIDGRAAAYVCRDFTCRQPVTTAEALEREL